MYFPLGIPKIWSLFDNKDDITDNIDDFCKLRKEILRIHYIFMGLQVIRAKKSPVSPDHLGQPLIGIITTKCLLIASFRVREDGL
jgi:hypothetical protein